MLERTIYYHDTDAVGIAYYGSYFKFLEEGRTEFFQSKGVSVKGLHEKGFFFVVTDLKAKYLSPARFGDVVLCESRIADIAAAQVFFSQRIIKKEDGDVLLEAEITLVIVDKDFQPVAIPEDVRALLS